MLGRAFRLMLLLSLISAWCVFPLTAVGSEIIDPKHITTDNLVEYYRFLMRRWYDPDTYYYRFGVIAGPIPLYNYGTDTTRQLYNVLIVEGVVYFYPREVPVVKLSEYVYVILRLSDKEHYIPKFFLDRFLYEDFNEFKNVVRPDVVILPHEPVCIYLFFPIPIHYRYECSGLVNETIISAELFDELSSKFGIHGLSIHINYRIGLAIIYSTMDSVVGRMGRYNFTELVYRHTGVSLPRDMVVYVVYLPILSLGRFSIDVFKKPLDENALEALSMYGCRGYTRFGCYHFRDGKVSEILERYSVVRSVLGDIPAYYYGYVPELIGSTEYPVFTVKPVVDIPKCALNSFTRPRHSQESVLFITWIKNRDNPENLPPAITENIACIPGWLEEPVNETTTPEPTQTTTLPPTTTTTPAPILTPAPVDVSTTTITITTTIERVVEVPVTTVVEKTGSPGAQGEQSIIMLLVGLLIGLGVGFTLPRLVSKRMTG